jgi:hypothetical protein
MPEGVAITKDDVALRDQGNQKNHQAKSACEIRKISGHEQLSFEYSMQERLEPRMIVPKGSSYPVIPA